MRINEIFYSLQGEGRWTGTPAVFVRFSGCNLACGFCDTDHKPYTEYSEDEIVREVAKYPATHVVLTGGEPTLQLTGSLVAQLHSQDKFVQIETNGSVTLKDNLECTLDWITCSPKTAPLRIQRIDELKLLYEGEKSIEAIERFSTPGHLPAPIQCRCLQPLDTNDPVKNKQILEATIQYIKTHPLWTLSLQTHKLLHIR